MLSYLFNLYKAGGGGGGKRCITNMYIIMGYLRGICLEIRDVWTPFLKQASQWLSLHLIALLWEWENGKMEINMYKGKLTRK